MEDRPRSIVALAIGDQDLHFDLPEFLAKNGFEKTCGCAGSHSGKGQSLKHESLLFAARTVTFPKVGPCATRAGSSEKEMSL